MFSELDKKIVRALQEDLPLTSRPYEELAAQLGISEGELLDKINFFLEQGIIRRLGAAIRHREAGFKANAMVVWNVADERTKEVGQKMAGFAEVSHCYERPRFPQWPYNLFTMVHGKSREECYQIAEKIAQTVGVTDYQLLFSTDEFKKTSMKYFV